MADAGAATTGTEAPGRATALPGKASDDDAGGASPAGEPVEALKALAHPVRLRMVEMLADGGGELCVCHFEEAFDLSQPTISHHLKRLREAGLVDSRRDGSWVHHRIRREAMAGLSGLLAEWAAGASDEGACC